ncbi:hypothetical protein BO221_12335 [Archangium sp. Cb G35]|uniref:hypothetical protein n=1 Tax=Archangium sp. Cb G35 TaxID=1920190 RepID=UPI00093712DA|nr:hypothetical protein [Archangium sp. Cb G35]OJT25155.1 hypothetical protein BO221_12335 [Archangium sp. Cb G35]
MSSYVFTSKSHGVDVEVDLSSQVLALEAIEQESFWLQRARLSQQRNSNEPYLYPWLTGMHWGWAPAMAFALKAKAFDDGLYAAVDLLMQHGTPLLPGKRGIVEHVHQELLSHWSPEAADPLRSALVLVRAALSMTGTLEEPDKKLRLLVVKSLREFESDAGKSKPLGFYTWSSRLQALFKQDRLLQEELTPDVAQTLHAALQTDEHLLDAWRRHLRLLGRLTNPLAKPALDEEGDSRCFFPPSDSQEGRLVKELFSKKSPPEGFQLVDELITRIRSGRSTTPTPRSGWYDHQFHALVPFLMPERMPEAKRLVLGPRYRAELEKQFRALFALTRETHIKQLEQAVAGSGGPPPLIIEPSLSIEPLAEFYRRRAEGYLFLRQVLCELLGAPALANIRRVMPTGETEEPLLDELVWMEQLFRGAHAIVRQELGVEAVPEAWLPAAQITRRWLRQWKEDPALTQDARCVVPLFFDRERQKTKVMAVLGFHPTDVVVDFKQPPKVRVTDSRGHAVSGLDVYFGAAEHPTVCPVTAELYVSQVPDRAEFQAICDKYVSTRAILESLQG